MRRDTLLRYFRRIVLTTLPYGGIVIPGCLGTCPEMYQHFSGVVQLDGGITQDDAGCSTACEEASNHVFGTVHQCELDSDGGVTTVQCDVRIQCIGGRRHEGLGEADVSGADPVAAWLARLAHLEGASVAAFARLEAELRDHGAPEALLRRTRVAARDEIRHQRVVGGLAEQRGARLAPVEKPTFGARPLVEIAIENAAEGCVRETFGALVACWQAEAARDARVRESFARIAVDEARHAELAAAVDRWAATQLDEESRARVRAAKQAAAAELARSIEGAPVDASLVEELGLPTRAVGRKLLAAAQPTWS